jgi:hypothetical protein
MKSTSSIVLCLITGSLAFGASLVGCGDDTGTTSDAGGGMDATKDTGGGIDSTANDTGSGNDTGGGDTSTGDDTGTSEAGGDDTGAGEAGGEAGPTDGGTDGPTDGGLDGAIGLDCPSYCALMKANCTGANAQYTADSECLNACAQVPVGMVTDKMGNTLGCHLYHAELAATAPNPHCWHAGPYGFGVCGANCDDFCLLATTWCSAAGGFDGGPAPYTSVGNCTSACMKFVVADAGADPGAFSAAGPTGGNTLDCREWHLGKALVDQSATGQQLHCNHVGATSPTCM